MRRLLVTLALLSPLPALASYDCNSTDDDLAGTFTTQRGQPATIFAYVKYANHPEAVNNIVQVGAGAGTQSASISIITQTGADSYQAASRNAGGAATAATQSSAAGAGDGIWFPVLATFTNTTRRDIYVGSLAVTDDDTTSNDPGSAWDEVRLCESFAGSNDSTTLGIAVVGLINRVASGPEITSFMSGQDPTTIWSLSTELIGYWTLATNNATQPNDGFDATGDLSVSGAAFNADQPTFGPTFSVAPAESTNTATTVLVTYTSANATDLHWALRNSGTSAYADCAAVQAASGAIDSDSEAVSADVLIPFVHPEGDIDLCLEGASGVNSVVTLNDVLRSPCTGCAFRELAALSDTSPFKVQSDTSASTEEDSNLICDIANPEYFPVGSLLDASAGFADGVLLVGDNSTTPNCVAVDQLAMSSEDPITVTGKVAPDGSSLLGVTAPAAGDVLEFEDDTDVDWDDGWDLDTDAEGFVTLTQCPQDVSDSSPEYATPLNCRTGSPFLIYPNNVPPTLDLEPIFGIAFNTGESIVADLSEMCSHSNLTPTFAVRDGYMLPAGATLVGDQLTINPTSGQEDENGFDVPILCGADTLYDVQNWRAYFINTGTMPEITDEQCLDAFDDCEAYDTLLAAFPWRDGTGISASFTCSASEVSGEVIFQSPAAAAEIEPYASISFQVSTGPCVGRRGGRGITLPGLSPFL
jgi:hypothetical protein